MWSLALTLCIGVVLVSEGVSDDVLSCLFGQGCLHGCNCAVSCDTQTGCTGQCAAGWDGPTCQRQNVALKRSTKQSSTHAKDSQTFTSQYAVDGQIGHTVWTTPCTHTSEVRSAPPATWGVTLDRVYRISRFQIYNRNGTCSEGPCGSRLAGFTLSVGNSSSQSYKACYNDTTPDGQNPGDIISESCNQGGPLSGNRVQISAKTGQVLTLCEVLVYVCSVGSYGQSCGQTCGLCAQGRTACDIFTGNCPDRQGLPRCEAGYSGRSCQTACNSGKWGPDCLQSCGQCHNRADCDKSSGECPAVSPRCSTGYMGQMCNTACPSGRHGEDCLGTCHCKNQNSCNKADGTCDQQGCSAGYTGDNCQTVVTSPTACDVGKYGPNCGQVCDCPRRHSTACDRTTGSCRAECFPGYWSTDCNNQCDCENRQTPACDRATGSCTATDCKTGYWNTSCDRKCACPNRVTWTCDRKTGVCTSLCSNDFTGKQCETDIKPCAEGRYGSNCTLLCTCPRRQSPACHKTSGLCTADCRTGYWDTNCERNCTCPNRQSDICNRTTSLCMSLCNNDFTGEDCKTESFLKTSDDSSVGWIAGVVVVVIVSVIVFLYAVVVTLKWQRIHRRLQEEIKARYVACKVNPTQDQPGPVYEEVGNSL